MPIFTLLGACVNVFCIANLAGEKKKWIVTCCSESRPSIWARECGGSKDSMEDYFDVMVTTRVLDFVSIDERKISSAPKCMELSALDFFQASPTDGECHFNLF